MTFPKKTISQRGANLKRKPAMIAANCPPPRTPTLSRSNAIVGDSSVVQLSLAPPSRPLTRSSARLDKALKTCNFGHIVSNSNINNINNNDDNNNNNNISNNINSIPTSTLNHNNNNRDVSVTLKRGLSSVGNDRAPKKINFDISDSSEVTSVISSKRKYTKILATHSRSSNRLRATVMARNVAFSFTDSVFENFNALGHSVFDKVSVSETALNHPTDWLSDLDISNVGHYILNSQSVDNVRLVPPTFFYLFKNDITSAPAITSAFLASSGPPIDFFFIPLCSNSHWTLYIIRCLVGDILFVNSLHQSQCHSDMQSFITLFCPAAASFTFKNNFSLPLQMDPYSCGIFVLRAMELFLTSPSTTGDIDFSFSDNLQSLRLKYFHFLFPNEVSTYSLQPDTASISTSISVLLPHKKQNKEFKINKQSKLIKQNNNNNNINNSSTDFTPAQIQYKDITNFTSHELQTLNISLHKNALSALNYTECPNCFCNFYNVTFENNRKICKKCRHCPDKYTSLNEMQPSPLPSEFLNLSLYEQLVISSVHTNVLIIRLKYGQVAISGYTAFLEQDVSGFAAKLPNLRAPIIIVGRMREDGRVQQMKIRRDKVVGALKYLKANNPGYADKVIDVALLNSLPDDGYAEATNFIQDRPSFDDDGNLLSYARPSDSIDCGILSSFSFDSTVGSHNDILRRHRLVDFPARSIDLLNEFQTPNLCSQAFPHLFPDGKPEYFRGVGNWRPIQKVNFRDWASHLFSHRESRFREDVVFKFYCVNTIQRHEILFCGRLALRVTDLHERYSIDELREKIADDSFRKSLDSYRMSVQGSRGYWNNHRGNLESMCRELGLPQLFVTLNSNDHHWHDLRLLMQSRSSPSSASSSLIELLKTDPFTPVSYFHSKVQTFLRDFFIAHLGVEYYFGKVEFQARGSIHVHFLMWHRDRASFSSEGYINAPFIVEWADKYVSAMNPYYGVQTTFSFNELLAMTPEQIPELIDHANKLVSFVGRHTKCGGHCLKSNNKCRFGFPKQINTKTNIHLCPRSRCLEIVYKQNDPLAMSHIKPLIGLWQGNCECQIVLSKTKLFSYLCKYVCKEEKASPVQERIESMLCQHANISRLGLIQKCFMAQSRREVTAQEAANNLLDLPFVISNATFKKVCTNYVAHVSPFSGSSSTDLSKYINRPSDLENKTMYEIFKHYNIAPKNNTFTLIKSDTQKSVIVPKSYAAFGSEAFFRRECLLHLSWRDESILLGKNPTWEALYKTITTFPYKENFHFNPDDLERIDPSDMGHFVDNSVALERDQEMDEYLDAFHDQVISYKTLTADHGFKHYEEFSWRESSRIVDYSQVLDFLKTLRSTTNNGNSAPSAAIDTSLFNAQQLQIYNTVKSHFQSVNPDQLLLLVQGASGTGKSFLIHSLRELLASAAVVCAPTGCAAFLINGVTIHSLFSIFGENNLSSKRALELSTTTFKSVKYIIIDEFSMVGLSLFGKVESRLRAIFPERSNLAFAGMSVILLGDLHQLPPVKDYPLFSTFFKRGANDDVRNGRRAYSLFRKTAFLTIKMRQNGDSEMSDFLDRLKYGACTPSDVCSLRERVYNTAAPHSEFSSALHLFQDNNTCEAFNNSRLRELESSTNPVAVIVGEGVYRNMRYKSNKAVGGAKIRVFLTIGARVMLTSNISVTLGLVNGSLGYVRHILYYANSPPTPPDVVLVEFDHYTGPTLINNCIPIVPIACEGTKASLRMVKNTPLNPAYGITVHKCQGMTVGKCVCNLGPSEQHIGLAYVALSRVKNFRDLLVYPFKADRLNSIKNRPEFPFRVREEQRLLGLNIL